MLEEISPDISPPPEFDVDDDVLPSSETILSVEEGRLPVSVVTATLWRYLQFQSARTTEFYTGDNNAHSQLHDWLLEGSGDARLRAIIYVTNTVTFSLEELSSDLHIARRMSMELNLLRNWALYEACIRQPPSY